MAYANVAEVKSLLIGKVRFGDDDTDPNKLGPKLFTQLINEAEMQVELHLSKRYQTPFVGISNEPFLKISNPSTRMIIATVAKLQSVMRILETDFGRGSAVAGDEYYKGVEKRYEKMLDTLIGEREDSHGYKWPPLQGLQLNWANKQGDDGYPGAVLNSSRDMGPTYATGQINDPSQTFWNGGLDDDNCR